MLPLRTTPQGAAVVRANDDLLPGIHPEAAGHPVSRRVDAYRAHPILTKSCMSDTHLGPKLARLPCRRTGSAIITASRVMARFLSGRSWRRSRGCGSV